jgi:hypothetical protein
MICVYWVCSILCTAFVIRSYYVSIKFINPAFIILLIRNTIRMLDLEQSKEHTSNIWFWALFLSQLTVIVSIIIAWLFLVRTCKPFNYSISIICVATAYIGFLKNIDGASEQLLTSEGIKIICWLIFGIISWLFLMNYVFMSIENDIIQTFGKRIQQQEEFNSILDHLEESIMIVSQN